MVVSGPARGQMWADRITESAGYEPLLDNDGTRLTFARWYKRWLAEAERELGLMHSIASITHSCQYCQKVVVSEDWDFEMDDEKNEFLNVHLGVTLADLVDASRHGCDLAQYLLKAAESVEKANCPEKLMLSACIILYNDDKHKDHADHFQTMALWNTQTKSIEEELRPMFALCTPSGEYYYLYCRTEWRGLRVTGNVVGVLTHQMDRC